MNHIEDIHTSIDVYMASDDFAARCAIACQALDDCGALSDQQLAELLGLPESLVASAMETMAKKLFADNGGLQ